MGVTATRATFACGCTGAGAFDKCVRRQKRVAAPLSWQ
jgi:hypothetical protein